VTISLSLDEYLSIRDGFMAVVEIPMECIVGYLNHENEIQCRVVNTSLDRTNKTLLLSLVRANDQGESHGSAAEVPAAAPQVNAVANGQADDYDWGAHRVVRESFHP
jgi:hypothetical protein